MPRYPDIEVRVQSRNPLALVAAVRQAMRRARVEKGAVDEFSFEAMTASSDASRVLEVCEQWVGDVRAA